MSKKLLILFQQMWKIYLLGCIGYFLTVRCEAQQLNINLYRATSNVFADGVVALFGSNYTTAVISSEDFAKFKNFNETFGLRRDSIELGLEARPLVSSNDTLYFNINNFVIGDYRLVIDGSNFSNTTAILKDQYNSTQTTINLNDTTFYNFTVNNDIASVSNNRFIITFASTSGQLSVIATPSSSFLLSDASTGGVFVKMSPNPVNNQLIVSFRNALVEEKAIRIINSLGQVVKTLKVGNIATGNIAVSVSDLAVGVYTVQLLSGGKQLSAQKIVKQ